MESQAVTVSESPFVQVGIVTHEGRDYHALGATISDDYLAAYLKPRDMGPNVKANGGTLTTWEGKPIGRYIITGRWEWWNSWCSLVRMESVLCILDDGRRYVGRKSQDWDLIKARRAKGSS